MGVSAVIGRALAQNSSDSRCAFGCDWFGVLPCLLIFALGWLSFVGFLTSPVVKILGALWVVLCTYDTLLSQVIPESWGQRFPKAREIVFMTSGWLPFWGWLLILAAGIVLASFEYAHRRAPHPVAEPTVTSAPLSRRNWLPEISGALILLLLTTGSSYWLTFRARIQKLLTSPQAQSGPSSRGFNTIGEVATNNRPSSPAARRTKRHCERQDWISRKPFVFHGNLRRQYEDYISNTDNFDIAFNVCRNAGIVRSRMLHHQS